jgi:hypothetical protein
MSLGRVWSSSQQPYRKHCKNQSDDGYEKPAGFAQTVIHGRLLQTLEHEHRVVF